MRHTTETTTLTPAATAALASELYLHKLWATPEETEIWLKTETGSYIAALIEKERRNRN